MDFSHMTNREVLDVYSSSIEELTKRQILRTKNMTGELGEFIVTDYFNQNANLPNLKLCNVGSSHYDAKDSEGKSYSIKTITGKMTGSFTGLEPIGSSSPDKKQFDYAVVCKLNSKTFRLEHIYLFTWEDFLEVKRWHSTNKQWYLLMSQDTLELAKVIL